MTDITEAMKGAALQGILEKDLALKDRTLRNLDRQTRLAELDDRRREEEHEERLKEFQDCRENRAKQLKAYEDHCFEMEKGQHKGINQAERHNQRVMTCHYMNLLMWLVALSYICGHLGGAF